MPQCNDYLKEIALSFFNKADIRSKNVKIKYSKYLKFTDFQHKSPVLGLIRSDIVVTTSAHLSVFGQLMAEQTEDSLKMMSLSKFDLEHLNYLEESLIWGFLRKRHFCSHRKPHRLS